MDTEVGTMRKTPGEDPGPECASCLVQIFCAPSFDDKILEVVAVFGGMQMAVSRVIKLQHHRIAQVRSHLRNHHLLVHRHLGEFSHATPRCLLSAAPSRSPSWATRASPSRWTAKPGSNHQGSLRSSTRTEPRCSPGTGYEGAAAPSVVLRLERVSLRRCVCSPCRPSRARSSRGRTSSSTTSLR